MERSTRPSNRFLRRSTPFYACILFLACLVLFNVTLLTLQITHFFEKHLFDVRKISAISQITSITMQASTVMILITLSYAMQIASSDNIIRRRQTVAVLHDNLMAWRGLGSSILALVKSRKLDVPSRLRILLAFMFFGGVSVLHIVTPSVITVGTFNATIPVSLNVSTILDIQSWMTSGPGMLLNPMPALPYLWSQLDSNTRVGLPAGVNGSVIFSTLPLIMTEDVIFQDPFARDLSVRCGILPRVSGDLFQVSYVGPGDISSFPTRTAIAITVQAGFIPYPGDGLQFYMSTRRIDMSTGGFAIGGNKESISTHPVFWFNDILINLAPTEDLFAAAFAYISTQNDSLRLDPSLGFPPPVQYNLQAQTWSFINNDTKNAFLEDVNATFYIWPIGCSLFAQNITAHVRGDNTLLWKNITHTPTNNSTFLHHDIPHDPLEIAWGDMILGIYASQMLMLMFPHIHNEIPQFLTTFELQLGSGLNSTNDSLALLGEQLSSMTALSCTLLAQTFRSSPDNVPQPHQPWSPVFATVSGSQSILMAGLVVQTLPLILGIVTCLILIFVFVASARPSTSSNNVLQDGQVINMVSILHNSSLPTVIPNSNEDLQRIQAMHTHVLYDGLTLDVDYIQERHHIPSPGIPLITLEGGNPQDEHLANRESMQASPSRPLDPGSHQPSQSQERRHWLFAGPQPYVIAYGVTITLLAAFYLFLIGLWSHHAFDHTLFNISRLGQVNQIVSVLSQAWAVATISVITFTVQAIASDLAIQQRQTVAALHDTLSSWLGVVYAVVALFQSQDHLQTRLRLVLTLVFFVSMTILHISTPSVITVHAINSTVPFNASVVRMPGNLTPIPVSIQTLANLQIVLPSISYLWNHRNSGISLPTGYNGTTLFSTLATPTQGNVFFEDPYAQSTVVQCGSVANATHNVFNITYTPGLDGAMLMFDLQLMVPISQNTTMKFTTSVTELTGHSFGGRKVSLDAPPNYWMDDQVQYLPSDQFNVTQPSNEMGTTAFAYISLHPDAFHMTSDEDKPVAIETHFKVWSWIENPSVPMIGMLDDLNMTFYIWPIVCSLSVHNVTAWVHVQGNTQLERTNARMALANLTTPSIKSIVPSDPMVISWSYLMDLLFLVELAPGPSRSTPLQGIFNQTWSLTSLEDQLSQFTAFYYAVLVHYWRSAALNGDLTASQWWSEARGFVVANQLTLFGRLDFSSSQLVLGCVCIIALMITSTLSILGVRVQQGALMDGGVMNMISLLRGSSLPGIIAGDGDEDLGKDGRRRRAQRTIVMYKDSTLDVPERLEGEVFPPNSGDNETTGLQSSVQAITSSEREDEHLPTNPWDHETTGLQSSLREIALSEQPEDERLPTNSGDDGSTEDLQYLIQMITLPQRQEDKDLPLNSEDSQTTDSQTLLRKVTLRERLEGDDLINSGDAESTQADLGK